MILLDFLNIYYVLHFCSTGNIYMYIYFLYYNVAKSLSQGEQDIMTYVR